MKTYNFNRLKTALILGSAAALVWLGMAPDSWGAKPVGAGPGYETICTGSATGTVEANSLTLTEKIQKGKISGSDPLRILFESTLGSSFLATVLAPAPGYLLDKIVVHVDPADDCNLDGAATYHFSKGSDVIVVEPTASGAPVISPSRQTIFDALKVPLGFSGVNFPAGNTEAVAEAVCDWIKDQINMDNTFNVTQAATIGALDGSMRIEMMRCLVNRLVEFRDTNDMVTNACTGDDVASGTFLSLISAPPPVSVSVSSDGLYTITNLDNNTSASATINGDGSCDVTPGDFSL